MSYAPPAGWVEVLPQNASNPFAPKALFHVDRDCPRIRTTAEGMRPVDRPYSATRCTACAATGERRGRA
jgi:hypothetical protein